LTVRHANVEQEFQDVRERLEVPVCRAMGVHKAWNACEALDADEVPTESVVYENGEGLTHLYPRFGAGDGNM